MEKLEIYTDDVILWKALNAGNKSCFNILFRKYYSELYYYGIKIISDSDIVKESIQEVFMRIWEKRANLADVENVKSYLICLIIGGRKLMLLCR